MSKTKKMTEAECHLLLLLTKVRETMGEQYGDGRKTVMAIWDYLNIAHDAVAQLDEENIRLKAANKRLKIRYEIDTTPPKVWQDHINRLEFTVEQYENYKTSDCLN